jgi:hypothetical protein
MGLDSRFRPSAMLRKAMRAGGNDTLFYFDYVYFTAKRADWE